jgi:hypothetical protein
MHVKIKAYILKESSYFCVGGDVSLADEPFALFVAP